LTAWCKQNLKLIARRMRQLFSTRSLIGFWILKPKVLVTTLRVAHLEILGHAVAQLFETLRYKSEGRGFDSRRCYWNFLLTDSFGPHCGPGIDSASNRNEYQEYFLAVNVAVA
jgi:hypothetical protein